jgi:putative cardiolipin synthase
LAALGRAVQDASEFVRELLEGRLALEWAATRIVSDDPAKGLGLAVPETHLPSKLKRILGEPAAEVDLVSAISCLPPQGPMPSWHWPSAA